MAGTHRRNAILITIGLSAISPFGDHRSTLWSQDRTHALAPDHLGCLVDDATLAAIQEADFLSEEFGHVRAGGAPPPLSNQFFYGELTYVEFINPRLASPLGVEVGDCMIALNTERAGWLSQLYDDVRERHPQMNPDFGLRELNRGSARVPWYYVLDFDFESGIGGFDIWFKEYHPEFKYRMAPDHDEPGDVSRRRGAPQVAFHPDKYFRDVVGVTVAVSEERRSQLERLLGLAGFSPSGGEGSTWSTDGFVLEFIAAPQAGEYAIREIRLTLTRPFTGSRRSYDLGSVTLEFTDDTSAVLRFRGPRA